MTRMWKVVVAAAVVGGLACGGGLPPEAPSSDGKAAGLEKRKPPAQASSGVVVLTRNLYVGTDVGAILGASSPADIPFLVQQAFEDVQQSLPAERMDAIAGEIATLRPHVVGLQEVALLRTQFPGDTFSGSPTPATSVAFDFLDLLLDALEARGLDYVPAAIVTNADIEVPSASGADIRLTDHDVLLVRSDVEFDDVEAHNFAARLVVPLGGPGGPVVSIVRGWVEADVTVGRRTVHVANAHLEPAPVPPIVPIQVAQANELLAAVSDEEGTVVLLGDYNSAADGSTTPTYATLLDAGFVDVWSQDRPRDPGYTCCQDADLRNSESELDERIDLVLVRQPGAPGDRIVGGVDAEVIGDDPADRTASGLWPSDHAGVGATLRLPLGKRFALEE